MSAVSLTFGTFETQSIKRQREMVNADLGPESGLFDIPKVCMSLCGYRKSYGLRHVVFGVSHKGFELMTTSMLVSHRLRLYN